MIMRILLALAALATSAAASARTDPARYMDAKLIAETVVPKPGSTILVGFRFTPKPGWHGYWSNPGDSGIAPTVRWTAPVGVSFGPLLHPAPTLIGADGISSFVHEGPHILLSRMTIGKSIASGDAIPIKGDLSWAACTATQCVPLRASFTLDLVAGDGAIGPDAAILRATANKLPRSASGATFTVGGKRLRLQLPETLHLDASRTRFFPDEGGQFDAASQVSTQGAISAWMKGVMPRLLSGVVSDGSRSYRVTFKPRPHSDKEETPEASEPTLEGHANAATFEVSRDGAPNRPTTVRPPSQEPARATWPWLLLAFLMPIAAAGWLWRRRH